MRSPFQVLVVPFRRTASGLEFAVLRRADAGWWQFVAGGGEDDETPREAAAREAEEELGIAGEVMALDSTATVPKDCFADAASWGPDVYVVPEYSFAVDVGASAVTLSDEHAAIRWLPYEQARSVLEWDSNRTALWELNERLREG
ncbi:MAG: NUDIX domain-containing protein [Candidatus Brocadiia bacterium]